MTFACLAALDVKPQHDLSWPLPWQMVLCAAILPLNSFNLASDPDFLAKVGPIVVYSTLLRRRAASSSELARTGVTVLLPTRTIRWPNIDITLQLVNVSILVYFGMSMI